MFDSWISFEGAVFSLVEEIHVSRVYFSPAMYTWLLHSFVLF